MFGIVTPPVYHNPASITVGSGYHTIVTPGIPTLLVRHGAPVLEHFLPHLVIPVSGPVFAGRLHDLLFYCKRRRDRTPRKEPIVPVLGAYRDATLESQTLFNLAVEKVKRNNFRDAITNLVDALKIAPANPSYRSFFGFCLAQIEDDFDRAIRYCRSASEARPLDPMLHVNLGKVYKLSGDNSAAHKEFVKAWDVCRGHPAAAAELTRMGIRRPSVVRFLSRSHWVNRYLGMARATLERRLLHRRMC